MCEPLFLPSSARATICIRKTKSTFYVIISVKLLLSTKHFDPNEKAGAFFSRHDLRGKTYEHGDGVPFSSAYCTIKWPVTG